MTARPSPGTGAAGPVLERAFFDRPSPLVARELLGCWLVRRRPGRLVRVQLCETEAYLGREDPASHARRGPTARNLAMFGMPGTAYVYFIYGLHHCFNIVTGAPGVAAAVLVRAALPDPALDGRLDGPARLSRALDIGPAQNGVDLCDPQAGEIWLERGRRPRGAAVVVGSRVGVEDQTPWRFRLVPGATAGTRSGRPLGGKERASPQGARSNI